MTANELRLGNLFNFKNEDRSEIAPIYSFNYNLSLISSGTPESNMAYPFNGVTIEPIPLTEEWLLKFGFENDKITYWQEYTMNGGQVLYVVVAEYKDGFYFLPIGQIDIVGIKLEYVHQLQNLYFALTEKELQAK